MAEDDLVTVEEAFQIAEEVCREELRKRFGIGGVLGRVGGGGGSVQPSLSAAVGGSGALYNSIQDAIDSEPITSQSFVPQAGTASGVVVLPAAMSGSADAYKEFWVIDSSVAPSNGLVYRAAAALAALVLGQTVGKALEAVGATVAGEAYSEINCR